MDLEVLRNNIALKTKKGLSFIIASVFIWSGILVICLLPDLNPITRNLYTFCITAPLMPLAYLISRVIGADFSVKDNPLNNLGLLFSLNQMLYILIAMWVYAAVPDKMVMILAIIFGAHLLPFGWLYQSKTSSVYPLFMK